MGDCQQGPGLVFFEEADEDLVFDRHSLANEGVTGDLAARADEGDDPARLSMLPAAVVRVTAQLASPTWT